MINKKNRYCAIKSNDVNRRWIEILTSNKDGQIYSVMAWTPLKPGGKGVSAIARRGASVLPKLDEKDLGAFNIPHVPSNSEDGLVFWRGKTFDRFVFKKKDQDDEDEQDPKKHFENLFCRVFDMKCVALTRNMADVIVLREIDNGHRFLMFVRGRVGLWRSLPPV